MHMLKREAILGVKDRELRKVEVPEWNGFVFMSEMTGAERDEYELLITGRLANGKLDFRKLKGEVLIKFGISDNDGKRLFTMTDLDSFESKNGEVIDRLFNIWREVNKLDNGASTKNSKGLNEEHGTDSQSV